MRSEERPGFLSTRSIIAGVITAVMITITILASGGVMFSPGALNAHPGKVLGGVASHAEIAGNCKACHVEPWSRITMDDRCSYCHVDVALEMLDPTTAHGRMQVIDPQATCRTCHPEHRGPDALLTVIEGWQFPHEVSRFKLNSHQLTAAKEPFLCADCHGEDVTQFDVLTCAKCHISMDMPFMVNHEVAFGDQCLECHDGVERYGRDFDHNQFAFKLEGKHAGLICAQCHRQATTVAAMQMTSQFCFSCHGKDDAHKGSLGPDCASCHTPQGWLPSTFDHNRSDFKLTGAHTRVVCEQCHVNAVFKGAPKDCYSCHKQNDAHMGQFGTVCANCHSTEAWLPALFDHDATGFKLIGSHQNVDCKACHVNGIFAQTPRDCYSCHAAQDAHKGQYGTNCGACHQPTQWPAARFDHNATAFPLVGKHVSVSCLSCHKNGSFRGTPQNCFTCHAKDDKHNGQLGTNCATCHVPTGWNVRIFDHNTTAFPLTGQHAQLECAQCHQSGQFKISTNCVSCHSEPVFHMGAFGTSCEQCHTTTAWLPAPFMGTHFTALGQNFLDHHGATCKTCHTTTVHEYTCLACHASDPLGSQNQTPAPTITETPTIQSTVVTSIPNSTIHIGDTIQVVVSLSAVPTQGYTSAEFTCAYDPTLVDVSGITVGNLFGNDEVASIAGPQNGSFILAVAGSHAQKASSDGVAFTFNAKGLSAGTTTMNCSARVSTGTNTLQSIYSIPATITIVELNPTAVPGSSSVTGQALASKLVTIQLYNPDHSLVATGTVDPNGMFSVAAPAGTYTISATAEGFLGAQGSVTLVNGGSVAMPVISLIAGDVDNNGVIDQLDGLTIRMNYNSAIPTAADLNNDGVINVLDLGLFAGNLGKSGPIPWS